MHKEPLSGPRLFHAKVRRRTEKGYMPFIAKLTATDESGDLPCGPERPQVRKIRASDEQVTRGDAVATSVRQRPSLRRTRFAPSSLVAPDHVQGI